MADVLLTGAAGFIASHLLRRLNEAGIAEITISDSIGSTDKWKNIADCQFRQYIPYDLLLDSIKRYTFDKIIHLGACSDPTYNDFDWLFEVNTRFTRDLWNFACERRIPFYYASSASVYGDGAYGFSDIHKYTPHLKPRSAYAMSKWLFDNWAIGQHTTPPHWIGFRLFNVYGENEWHKGRYASMPYQMIKSALNQESIKLFGHEGEEEPYYRDFVYVEDALNMMTHLMETENVNGIYNIGTGRSRTYIEIAEKVISICNTDTKIEFIPMPDDLRWSFQRYTLADMSKLDQAGYKGRMTNYDAALRRIRLELSQ